MTVHRRYCQDSPDAIASCALDDMVLLYHRSSGQTHMVISPVPEILATLDDGAAWTAGEVLGQLARLYDLGAAEEALPQVEAHLVELTALGLVRIA
ncbi:HPr-rel-A system PqqD family peptide chaperone [Sphingobium estronivorans]|uniref:HPr-rel-A system PqqD family peptide chaperone n=1 Tax=Sphingobium estronivorans TaxID=1577690 RepID=UPI001F071A4C|nr:HPr-rel-A system PqqD family peptide chaperone [Sphingobium estronivorans]